mmetsp:Transcript_7350/g.16655  ORF Transcript_7350/g.16655 Transcript_7350/m.16655 type:complete len:672 (-) Transcript_7350:288-2303(-)|eukprot:CAMPEP_0172321622 /NCGR_PEP_ID=MMETSP1058-20130122/43886_1 /TAXON_ID=83371 /ORGANISM="Detonula confervacea, Strain CCMP 353" /LENGTH=671 /DNA_ID=CAMNT_0013037181 /DNA_START=288 /DNA_END=2303 /DNA_ORIENTATION=-
MERKLYLEQNSSGEDVLYMDPKAHDPMLQLSSIAAAFPSEEFKDRNGIVLLAPTPGNCGTSLNVVSWRFVPTSMSQPHQSSSQEMADAIAFFESKIIGNSEFDVNSIGDHVEAVMGIAGTVAEHEEYIPGVKACLEVVAAIGEKTPYLGAAFSLLHFAISTYDNVQSNKSDLLALINSWGRLENRLEEDKIKTEILALAESYFSKSSKERARDAKKIASQLEVLRDRIRDEIHVNLVEGVAEIGEIGNDLTKRLNNGVESILANIREVKEIVDKGFISIRDDISKGFDRIETAPKLPPSMLPDCPELFGRTETLKSLKGSFERGGTIAALVGAAGTGKSHCAKRFARDWIEEYHEKRFALWFSAETEIGIRADYLAVWEELGIKSNDKAEQMPTSELANCIWSELKTSQFEWILVFDNVPEALGGSEGPAVFQPWFFPTPLKNWGHGRILFTTRSNAYAGPTCLGQVKKIAVTTLKETESVEMLLDNVLNEDDNKALTEESKNAAKLLVGKKYFDGLPLAIATASGQIIDEGMTVQEYLEEIEQGVSDGVSSAINFALKSALRHARDNGLGGVLDIAAFISPDRMPFELLGSNKDTVRRCVKLNLLRCVETNVYSMHRLHQEAARKGTSPALALNAVKKILGDFSYRDSRTWKAGFAMLPHVEALKNQVEK